MVREEIGISLESKIAHLAEKLEEITQERNEWKKRYFKYVNRYELTRGSLDAYVKELNECRNKDKIFRELLKIEIEHPNKTNIEKVNSLRMILEQL